MRRGSRNRSALRDARRPARAASPGNTSRRPRVLAEAIGGVQSDGIITRRGALLNPVLFHLAVESGAADPQQRAALPRSPPVAARARAMARLALRNRDHGRRRRLVAGSAPAPDSTRAESCARARRRAMVLQRRRQVRHRSAPSESWRPCDRCRASVRARCPASRRPEQFQNLAARARSRQPGGPAVEEMLDQSGISSLRSRSGRQVDGEDVQPVEQVLAEAAGGDFGFQVAMRGGDDPQVHLAPLQRAHRRGTRAPASGAAA